MTIPTGTLHPGSLPDPDETPTYFTQADLLALTERVLPDWYLEPLKSPGPGYEIVQEFAKIFERASLAVGRSELQMFVTSATGGAKIRILVRFFRDTALAGAFILKKGTVVRASRSGREFVLTSDTEFSGGGLDAENEVEAIAYGPEYAEPGELVTADGTAILGEIDEIVLPLMDPPLADLTLQVEQHDPPNPSSPGLAAALDQIGRDRGLPRLPDESDPLYRGRIAQIPDTISPDALRRQLDAALLPRGLSYDLIETWEARYQSCWDAPDGIPVDPIFGPMVAWAYDDPRTDGFFGRWMDVEDERGAFVVVLQDAGPIEMRAMAWDDPTTTKAEHAFASGRRAHSAWDVTTPEQDDSNILLGVWDGYDAGRDAFYRDLYALIRSAAGGGVHISFELQGE